jgi:DNA-binding response OmpR family regulator
VRLSSGAIARETSSPIGTTLTSQPPESGTIEKPLDVIVVDDDVDTRMMLRTLFEAQGWLVRDFDEVDGARASARLRAPDVLVTDLQIDEPMDGLELALCHCPETSDVACILMTGHAVEHAVARAFDDYLVKPVAIATLLDRVRAIGEQGRSARGRARTG